ncbi:MAG: response regulator [Nitrospirae bacterium]|nr:response regulator [Nitrospirota bacterium]
MNNKKELRKHKRIPFLKDIIINNKILVKGIDISEEGLYVHTGRSFTPGNIVDVTLPIKDITITVKANIQHNQPSVGMGLKFVELTDEQKDVIKKHIEYLATQTSPDNSEKKCILLVEDSDTSRRVCKSKLVSEGFQVNEVKDGYEAIKYLNVDKTDLIVLDLHMENIDGFKVLAMLKASEQWRDIPVIVFSSKSSQDTINKVLDAGADEFLSKMMTSPKKLVETIENLLKRKKS